jgi:hypothetical protein
MRNSFVLAAALSLAVAGLFPTAAAAQAPECDNAGPFCIDGVLPDVNAGPATADPHGNGQAGQELGPKNGSSTKIGVIDNAALPMLDFTNPNAQVDLNTVYIRGALDTSGQVWLYFAWVRDSNTGSGFVSLEAQVADSPCTYPITTVGQCNPWQNRANGDPLFSWDQQGNSRDIYFRVYSSSTGGFVTPTPCPGEVVAGLGCKLDETVAKAQYSADGFGGELALNLSALFTIPPGQCEVFNNIIPGTVTGNSDTADYKDVVLAPLSVQLCGILQIQKVTQNQAGAEFKDETTVFQYQVAGPVNRGPSNIKSRLNGPSETKTESELLPGTYTVTELPVPAGYTFVSLVCDGKTTPPTNVVTLAAGDTKLCVITNRLNPNSPNGETVPHVSLRDEMVVTQILRITNDSASAFTVTFRLYTSEAACAADTARTGGEVFGPVQLNITSTVGGFSSGSAATHAQGTGVEKPFSATPYAWWAEFSGNSLNGLVINNKKTSGCSEEKVLVSRVQ